MQTQEKVHPIARKLPMCGSLCSQLAFPTLLSLTFIASSSVLSSPHSPPASDTNKTTIDIPYDTPRAGNPLLPGYFADPSVLNADGKWYIYATIDPWGGDELGVWESVDFANWTFRSINWPTKRAASSPESNGNKVWAPSVVRGRDGRYWMYVSVGSEIWVGTASHPLGPWHDANRGKPLIGRNYRPGFHMIDAEAFIDDDGTPYLYWGSGLNWANGHCFVVKLNADMVHFEGEPKDITPSNYFEGPFMFKSDGEYFLTYSNGKTTSDTYEVRYAVGASPVGPFKEQKNEPILSTDRPRQIISPGHHAIMRADGETYILYHRQALPFVEGEDMRRQVAIDRFEVSPEKTLLKIAASNSGQRPGPIRRKTGLAYAITATNTSDAAHSAQKAMDDNYATLWRAPSKGTGWLTADFGKPTMISQSEIRPEYPMRSYRFDMLVSQDGNRWTPVISQARTRGSPIILKHPARVRFVRLKAEAGAGIFEWLIE